MDRIGQAMGFGSVELNESTGEWQLKPDVHQRYLQPLNWNDAEIRRTASDGSLWASMTAQADTQALQQMVATGQIHTLEDSDPAWSSDEVGQLMGLDPATLQELARADLAPGVGGTPNGDQHRMAYGLPAALAMEEAMAREAATQRLAANPMGDKAVALFDTAWLNSAVLEAARTAQAISPIKV
ncbi:MAG: hypothetical protein C0451_13880 [Comamonadaceae bacterium]|nr:hypothetical protein [Comamonadaceae bacterium]